MADVKLQNKGIFSEKFFSKLKHKKNKKVINKKRNLGLKTVRADNEKKKKRIRKRKLNSRRCNEMSNANLNDVNMDEWQLKHQIAYWKSRAIALEYENKILHDQIRQIFENMEQQTNVSNTKYNKNKKYNQFLNTFSSKHYTTNKNVPSTSTKNVYGYSAQYNQHLFVNAPEEIEFEVNENWIKFMEQSAKHRADLKKQREADCENTNCDYSAENSNISDMGENERNKRRADMENLYGADCSKILACEMAMQCSYDIFIQTVNPPYWPNIPLRL